MTLAELKQRLTIPVIGAPLFIVSNPDLVMAQCTSGIVGAFPALNARPVEVLEQWLQRLTNALAEQISDVTLSIGLVQTGPLQFDEGSSLIRLADERMYAAKKALKEVNPKETH